MFTRSCLLLLAGFASAVQARPAGDHLKVLIAQSHTFRAQFVQALKDEKGVEIQKPTTGKVLIQQPGLFRWESAPPFNQLLVADGKKLWRYDEDLEQVSVKKMDDRLGKTPALLLSGKSENLEKVFTIKEKDNNTFVLTPLDKKDSMFDTLEVGFKDGKLTSMIMHDSLQQVTTIQYSDIQVNQPIDGEQFKFNPPAGVDVFHDDD